MPITLNHSNISVQYSSDKSYIIETVKSDLYRKNEIIDTIVRDNIQVAPVTPNIYIENGTNNVYAVESYTYSGTANTADFTRVFTKSTTCDILVVGGGGAGGGSYVGGGGGAGGYVYIPNFSLNGSYSIKVGRGGYSRSLGIVGENGQDSTFGIYTAVGGGGGASNPFPNTTVPASSGGSGGGGTTIGSSSPIRAGGSSTQIIYTSPIVSKGSAGRSSGTGPSRGGGGGGSGIAEGDTANGTSGTLNTISGNNVFYAAGGGGGNDATGVGALRYSGGSGIGGNGGNDNSGYKDGTDGTNGTGSGGGGSGGVGNSGKGGSGIVIIRYLLGTIPATNILTTVPIVSPNIYPFKTNVFTHSGGTENQTTYTINFPENTNCDILVVGGGGGGGYGNGGGGGAGQLVLIHQATLNGQYTIKVGKGGIGGNSPTKGTNSEFGTVIAEGGGANGGILKDGGSGAGGDGYTSNGGTTGGGNKNTTIDTFPGATVYSRGNNGGGEGSGSGGGGGGAGTEGQNGSTNGGQGGDGLSGISEINYDFKTNFGNYGNLETDGKYYFAGGGGGGAGGGVGGMGGGGKGGAGATSTPVAGLSGLINTGSGGGGGSGWGGGGGNGGSGIVVIRVNEGYFTESTRMFVHNGSSDSQSAYNINIPEDTICDMLIVAGGGGGGMDMGGGGGGGGVIELNNVLVTAGTYTVKVGKGGDGAPAAGTNQQNVGHQYQINGKQGSNSSFDNYIAIGGGYGGSSVHGHKLQGQGGDGGSGGGSSGYDPVNNVSKAGKAVEGQGFRGGYGGQSYYSGGGGGAGEVGGGPSTAAGGAYGGRGKLSNILGTPYYWGGGGGGAGYSTTGGNGGLGGGGGGAVGITTGGAGYFNGFAGGGGTTNSQTNTPGGNGAPHTGGGGGGGAHIGGGKGGDGGSGIVIIKLKSLSKTGKIPDVKSLNFSYDPVISFDPGKRAEYQAQLKTGVGGWRIVRYLPPTSPQWYQGDYISTSTFNIPTIGTPYNYTTEWAVPFGTFDEMCFGTLGMTYWLRCLKTSVLGTYDNAARPIISSSFSSTPYSANWYNRAGEVVDPWISIQNFPTQVVYGENKTNGSLTLIPLDGGMCVLVRDSTASTLIPSTIYTLNFPVPTLTNINTINNVVLEGQYDITINNNSSSIVSKTGKHVPKLASPITASTIGINYNVLKPVIDPVGAQWTYSSSNTNVYHMGSVGIGTTSPEYQLDVRGTIYSSSGGYTSSTLTKWSVLSDRRIKENIVKASYDKCLENVKNIELYNFNFKDNCVNTNDRHQLGFIAQEVQQVYPKAVEVGKMIVNLEQKIDDLLTLNITQIDYTLYGAVKSLIEKIENIKIKMEHIKTTYDIP
jgi:hypothetical protein